MIAGGSQDLGFGVTVSSGALVMSGTFAGVAKVGGQQLYASDLNSNAAVVVRLDPADGSMQWVDLIRGSGGLTPWNVRPVPGGDVVLAGTVRGSVGFGPVPFSPQHTITSAGGYYVVLARFGPGGAIRWASTTAGGPGDDDGSDVAALGNGNLLLSGRFSGDATFGSGPGSITLGPAAGTDGFLATYAGTGSVVGAEALTNTGAASVGGLAPGADGYVRLAVTADSPVTFRTTTYPTGTGGQYDGLVVTTTP